MLNRDLRTLFLGVAGVATVGLIGGAYMHPTLKSFDGPGGPQMLAGVAGERSDHSYDYAASWTSYQGQVPEYVVGTDWLKPPQYYADEDAPEYRDEPIEIEQADYSADTGDTSPAVAAVEEAPQPPAPEPATYPSMGGGITRSAAQPAEEQVPTTG